MAQFRVTLRRIAYAELVVEADSAKDARAQVSDPDDWFSMSDTIASDITTIASVKREDAPK
jgi:hypothetical protein